jgi:hypothetical protein
MTKFQTRDEFAADFHITHRGVKYNGRDLDKIYKQLLEKTSQTNLEVKKFDPLNLSEEKLKEITNWKIKLKASTWKSQLRTLRKKGKLDQYKIETLNKLGMVWNPKDDEWEKNYLYFKKKGFCYTLEVWIKEQRVLNELAQINIENLHRLQAINFPFNKEKNEQFPFTHNCLSPLLSIHFNKVSSAWNKINKREAEEESEESKITRSIFSRLGKITDSFPRNIYKLSYEESVSLIDMLAEGKATLRDHLIIAKHSQKIIDKNGLKGKFGNPKYYGSSSTSQYHFQPTEKFDIELCRILKIIGLKNDKILDDDLIWQGLKNFNTKKIKPTVRTYCCEKMLNFFETIWSERMRSFAPLDYLISFHKSEKNIDEILKLKNYIEKYPLLSLLYKDKIDKILMKL